MKCDDVMKRTSELAFDDLDAGERRDLEAHLSSCADCRAVAASDARTVAALRAVDPVEGSPGRRERTVAAMIAAQRQPQLKPAILMPRRRLIAASVAAAVLVALAVPLLYPRGGLSVGRLDGAAWIQRSGSRDFVALTIGDALRTGDWLRTDSVVGLEGPGGFKIVVNRLSRIAFDDSGPTPIL
ncbi:MAG TPA: zf-HC2 domain-containing protein, partial [Planctomycetota bacterium]|nr:zf-HC2 domain-containing protein [Planctomycetota bacterium]